MPKFPLSRRALLAGGLCFLSACALAYAYGPAAGAARRAAGRVSFAQSEFSVGEGAGAAAITLSRAGGADGRVAVKVTAADATAGAADYRHLSPGALDATFNPGAGPDGVAYLFPLPGGKMYAYGSFLKLNGVTRRYIARLNEDGSLDPTFVPATAPPGAAGGAVFQIAPQPDGKVLLLGGIPLPGNTGLWRLARLNADGSVDPTFNRIPTSISIAAMALQPDGKIIVVGYFTRLGNLTRRYAARLNADGSVDPSFDPGTLLYDGYVGDLELQPDGKLLIICNWLRPAYGDPVKTLLRLNGDGSQDSTFQLTAAANNLNAFAIGLQPDGRVLLGGRFRSADAAPTTATPLVRLHPDGGADASFADPRFGRYSWIEDLAVQPDGKLLVGGFTIGTHAQFLRRVDAGGHADASFVTHLPASYFPAPAGASAVAFQYDGKVLVGGQGGTRYVHRLENELFVTWEDGEAGDKTVRLPVFDDRLEEGDEQLTLDLALVAGAADVAPFPSALMTIVDDDEAPAITSATPTPAVLSVPYSHTFTATGQPAPTFSLLSGTLPPGLSLTPEGLLSGTPTAEGTYSLTVVAANGIGEPATQGFSLPVETSGTVQLSQATYAVAEGAGSALVTVTRSAGSVGTATVHYAASAQTASAADFTAVSGTLTFGPGQTSKTFSVPVANDVVNEPTETVLLALSGVGGSSALGSPSAATLELRDNDPVPSLSVADAVITEGDDGVATLDFKVTMTGRTERPVSFNARTVAGTAVGGEDYIPVAGTYVIPAGASSATVSVPVYGDTIAEADERLGLGVGSPVGAVVADGAASGLIKDNETAAGQPTVQLKSRSRAVSEGAGAVRIEVTRSGDISAPATVDYETVVSPGSASDRGDFNAAVGRLRFAAGESAKSFTVFITDDAFAEGAEPFEVLLSNPTGGAALGAPSEATVVIGDNDAQPGASNPIDGTAFFVRQHYRDFLNREPDAGGLKFWSDEIENCGADAQCRQVKRINVSAAFFLSIEFQETGYLAYRLHKAAFNAGERLDVRTFRRDTQEIGHDVAVGAPGWVEKLEANRQAFLDAFVTRPAFAALYPQTMTPAQFVEALAANTGDPLNPAAGPALTRAERAQLAAELSSGAKTRARVLRAVAEHAEFKRRQLNKAFVMMQYVGYLRRGPNQFPDANFDGYNFWLGKLNQFGGNFIRAEMVRAFLESIEYTQRFGR